MCAVEVPAKRALPGLAMISWGGVGGQRLQKGAGTAACSVKHGGQRGCLGRTYVYCFACHLDIEWDVPARLALSQG